MYSQIEMQSLKLFDTDKDATRFKVLKYADSKDFVMTDGKLTYIMPEDIEVIGADAFNGSSVQRVVFSPRLKKICDDAFSACSIEEAIIPNSVEDIGKGAFIYCKNLTKVVLPSGLKMLKARTFCDCTSLETIKFTAKIFYIGERCFETSGLKYLTIPGTVEVVDDGAFNGLKIEELSIEGAKTNFAKDAFHKTEIKNLCLAGQQLIFNNLDRYEEHLRESLMDAELLNKLSLLSQGLGKQHIQYAFALDLVKNNKQNEFVNAYFKYYNQLYKLYFGDIANPKPGLVAHLQKLCFNLGVFDKDVAQKPAEFLKLVYEPIGSRPIGETDEPADENDVEYGLSPRDLITLFHAMELKGYNEGFTSFFCTRKIFNGLMHRAKFGHDFISRVYNAYDEVQKYNVSKNAQHRQLAPTIAKFEKYFSTKFKGADKHPDIAMEMGKFTDNQEDFDYAVGIYEKYERMVSETGFVDDSIKEDDVFERIDYYSKQIVENMIDTATMLGELASKDYTYEWLAKNDKRNLMLGYYCSCCAHIAGAGEGITEASIILPNMQNLAIKDKHGDIKAKSTIFVNEEMGYAVCNNVEINIDTLADANSVKKIYDKYVMAVRIFVEKYNATHDVPITQVSVGMGKNDLEPLLQDAPRPSEILRAINFSKFGRRQYDGDWQKSQRLIYSSNEGVFLPVPGRR